MASVLSGQFITENRYPLDPPILAAASALFAPFLNWSLALAKCVILVKEWAAVANNWSYWTQLYDNKQGEELYKEMKTAYSAATGTGGLPMTDDLAWMSSAQVCAHLGISLRTLDRRRKKEVNPSLSLTTPM
ncbi:hypothetical protein [Budvicia aquatica]|uniref:Uncharacterized protein n=1 Tax=Budvicia aquatica TaxID=82979 RepID=A0A484ZRB1_9GAMM|nr:hypothetical protein [Budvicia aquatica]VFS51307.1 Uncharacterised protein [Budvicia aquatica]